MDIRTFRAATLQEALEQVRETLGPDAAVLHTRQVKRGRLGLFTSNLIEVEASVEMPVFRQVSQRPQSDAAVSNIAPASDAVGPESCAEPPSAATAMRTPQPAAENAESSSTKLPPAMIESLSEMLDAGVAPAEAKSLLQKAAQELAPEQMHDPWLIQGRICQLVIKNLHVAAPIEVHQGRQAVIALVGPTGAGKTTTLAKLASNFRLDQGCQVGLITMDTFRPGAVDQLLQYAETLDATLEVVSSPSQFMPALNRLQNCDVVFIDTAGRSPSDIEQITVLKALLEEAQPTSVQLVISAASSNGHILAALKQFSPLNLTGLVITKLDETVGFGSWLSILQNTELPVSYLAYGQRVPQDITAANQRRLASFLLGHGNQTANTA